MSDLKRLSIRLPADVQAELERQAELRALSPSTFARTVLTLWARDNGNRAYPASGDGSASPIRRIGRTLNTIRDE